MHLTVQPFGEDVGFVVPKQPPIVVRFVVWLDNSSII